MKSKPKKKNESEVNEEKKIDVWSFVNDISYNKQNIMDEDNKSEYQPWIVNLALSQYIDCIDAVMVMNMCHSLPPELQYSYYINTIRPRKRFTQWGKKDKNKEANLNVIREYYGYSIPKAEEALRILTEQQIAIIRKKIDKGGLAK